MTGNTTQAAIDAVDLMRGRDPDQAPAVRARFRRMLHAIFWFATGCAVAAALYAWIGFWCLAVPAVVGAVSAVLVAEVGGELTRNPARFATSGAMLRGSLRSRTQ